MAKSTVTMQYIANNLGISKVSVSKAINGQQGVGEALREKILETALKMGYNRVKKQESLPEGVKLGFMVPERYFLDSEDFYRVIYRTVLQQCSRKEILLTLFIITREEEAGCRLPAGIMSAKLDGIMLAGEIEDKFYSFLEQTKLPMVILDFYKPHMKQDAVITDNYQAGFQAAYHVIEKNHREIGFIGILNNSSNMDRFFGYRKALAMNDITFQAEWHISNINSKTCELMDYTLPEKLPTAFICHCDLAAFHLILKLRGLGLKVPQDVSVVSFDNTELAATFIPPITSMDIDKKGMGSKGLELLLWRIAHRQAEPKRIVMETKLIERDTARKL